MKKFAVLALTLAAIALTATDAFAFGRRGGRHCGGVSSCGQPVASCGQPVAFGCQSGGQPAGTVIVTSPLPPATGVIYAPAQPLPVTTGFAAPVPTVSGCSNGACTTTTGFGFFRRR